MAARPVCTTVPRSSGTVPCFAVMGKETRESAVSMRRRYVVCLTVTQRSELEAITRGACAEHRQVLRARIVLAAADGASNAAIGRLLAIDADTAGKWRRRFCRSGIEGLIDLPRSGRPRQFTAEVVAGVKALACELPTTAGCR